MTLLKLLEEYSVEIPKIQRDYAQGRDDDQTKEIREKLLDDMKKAIMDNDPLDLNFVYGAEDGGKFIPIDGQQRLTTLYLLHLYAFKDDSTKDELLKKFTYDTRTTSNKFFEYIIKNRAEIFNAPKPSEKITDSSEYVARYRYDPTVQSVLVMLDAIAEKFKDVKNLADTLANKEPLTFHFQNIENLGSSDDLYIKLNARGKPLTPFENFKAALLNRLKKLMESGEVEKEFKEAFDLKFDKDWTDLFWKSAKQDSGKYEELYQTFFEVLLFNYGLIDSKGFSDPSWVYSLKPDKIEADFFTAANNLLDYLNDNDNDVTKMIFDVLNDVSAKGCVKFHAVTVFLLRKSDLANTQAMTDWCRVFDNLADNTDITKYDNAESPIKSINTFAADDENIMNILKNIDNLSGGFNGNQLVEERKKAYIIREERKKNGGAVDGDFETAIKEAEKLEYFSGMIRAGLYPAEDTSKPYGYDLDKFKEYWGVIEELFGDYTGDNKNLKYGITLRRALLSFWDYPYEIGKGNGNYTFCTNYNNPENPHSLKLLLSDDKENTPKLMEKVCASNKSDIEGKLEEIIAENERSIKETDWEYYIIHNPKLFDIMSAEHYWFRKTPKFLLMKNKQSNGTNFDPFTRTLKAKLEDEGVTATCENETNLYPDDSKIGKTADGDYFIYFTKNGVKYMLRSEYEKPSDSDNPKFVGFKISEITLQADGTIDTEKELKTIKSDNPFTDTVEHITKNLV